MASITEIRKALVAAVAEITPHAMALSTGEKYDDAEDPFQHFVVRVLVGPPLEDNEELLDEMLAAEGPKSIKAALEADRTLGGLVGDIGISRHNGHRSYAVPGSEPALGSEWAVDVL
jgi:hypothetical protein